MNEFVLDKKYDNYFLFLDNEIVINDLFYRQIKSFSKKNKGDELIVDLVNLRENEIYKNKSSFRIKNILPHSLEILSSEYVNENKTYEDLLFEFLITDNTEEWAIYCHVGNDYGIGGCNNSLVNSFLEELKPYDKLSVEQKLEEIGSSFMDESKKDKFILDLLSNYNFNMM